MKGEREMGMRMGVIDGKWNIGNFTRAVVKIICHWFVFIRHLLHRFPFSYPKARALSISCKHEAYL